MLQTRTPPPLPVYQHVAGQCEERDLATQEAQIVLCSLTAFVESKELDLQAMSLLAKDNRILDKIMEREK